ncbi:MAG: FAD-binding and (Fe-S)-binding domain-containing protein [Rhodospirillales bacterium]
MAQAITAKAITNEDFAPATPHAALIRTLETLLPRSRIVTDPLRRLAYGTDASFYRLVPEVVAIVDTEAEVQGLLRMCRMYGTPVTFRAAGTSLSGQAVTDSVLCLMGDGWGGVAVADDAATIRLKPGVIGSEANRHLARFGRKIGPDPASINACKVGGIAANNASGMCCGTAQNSYNTLAAMRIIFADGSLLDTGDAGNRDAFRQTHRYLVDGIAALRSEILAEPELAARIRRKFAIKNTTGYSLNALVDFDDPIDILQHLMIGSEGTLGFISEITYRTVPEYAHKATSLMMFDGVVSACEAVIALKRTPVAAVELIDREGLRSVETKPGLPTFIRELPPGATALLVETRAEDAATLAANIAAIGQAVAGARTLRPIQFTTDPAEFERLWNIRKGLFPSVAAMRQTGTPVIIEDVAFPIESLAAATADLQGLFGEYGFADTFIFGHALEGNLHFVITPDLSSPAEIDRYRRFMDAVTHMVVEGYDGSLKAEHGTGRNMAPFVELEWGAQAYDLMRRIKLLLDPDGLLNPGVILNDDPEVYIKNVKPMAAADPLVDGCMECGFCEKMCPSQGMTFTPRQRIVGWREISRLAGPGADPGDAATRAAYLDTYAYQGLETCAACGLCALACPVGIETGLLTKKLRGAGQTAVSRRVAGFFGDHYGTAMAGVREGLRLVDLAARAFGSARMESMGGAARQWSGGRLPAWRPSMPRAAALRTQAPANGAGLAADAPTVVYLPACTSRTMGPAGNEPDATPLPQKTMALLQKAGFRVVLPDGLGNLCCGQPFESRGLYDVADTKSREVEEALRTASEDGRLPIVCDTSPCTLRLKQKLAESLRPVDIVEFIHDQVLPRLEIEKQATAVALHLTCSGRRMGLEGKLQAIGRACAAEVVMPAGVLCCGFAGDKGFNTPELKAHALRTLKAEVPAGCAGGYSHSRTCEIGLSDESGVPYRSIVYLVDQASRRKQSAG